MLEVGTRVRLIDETAPEEIRGMEGVIVRVDPEDLWGYHVEFEPSEDAAPVMEIFFPDHVIQMSAQDIEPL